MDKAKIQLTISTRAAAVLNAHASERKRGDFVTELLETYEKPDVSATDYEGLRLQVLGLASTVKGIDARVGRIEAQLAAMIASRAR